MALSLGICALIIILFAFKGYRRGFFSAIGGIVSIIAGYVAAFYGLKPASDWLKSNTELDGLLLFLICGIVIFAVVSIVVASLFNLIEGWLSSVHGPSTASKAGGLLVGCLVGIFFSVLIIYGVSIYQDYRPANNLPHQAYIKDKSRQIMSKATATVLSHSYPEAKKITQAMVENPVKVSQSLNSVFKNDNLKTLLNDPEHQQMLRDNDIESLTQSESFNQFFNDPDLQYLLLESDINQSGESTEIVLANHMSKMWRKLEASKDDEQIQAILNDPQFQAKLEAGNQFALMSDPQVLQLMNLLATKLE